MLQDRYVTDEINDITCSIDEILDERDKTYPRRIPLNTTSMQEALTAYASLIQRIQEPLWNPSEALVERTEAMTENAVFVCGYMKSGTTLLLGLLDGHPNLVVMPGDSHMLGRIHTRLDVSTTKGVEELADYWIHRLINPHGQKPFWIMGRDYRPHLDFLHYLNYWTERLPVAKRRAFLSVVLAYACANPMRPTDPKLWIEKTPGNERNVKEILELYPSARFIHITRDPRTNIDSLKRLAEVRGQNWKLESTAHAIRYSFKAGELNQKSLGSSRYHILRYEDLVADTEGQMWKVAQFMGIAPDQVLLRPTVNSLPAAANSMHDDSRAKSRSQPGVVLDMPNQRRKSDLDPQELSRISPILYPVARRFGYDYEGSLLAYHWKRVVYNTSAVLRKLRSHVDSING